MIDSQITNKKGRNTALRIIVFCMLAISFPILLNIILNLSTSRDIIGDEKLWLQFWATYGSALLAGGITIWFMVRTLKQNEFQFTNSLNSMRLNAKISLQEKRIIEYNILFREILHSISFSNSLSYELPIDSKQFSKRVLTALEFYDKLTIIFNKRINQSPEEKQFIIDFNEILNTIRNYNTLQSRIAFGRTSTTLEQGAKYLKDTYDNKSLYINNINMLTDTFIDAVLQCKSKLELDIFLDNEILKTLEEANYIHSKQLKTLINSLSEFQKSEERQLQSLISDITT